jgi:pimeloyl-ACP methyl ester carboxylesterase
MTSVTTLAMRLALARPWGLASWLAYYAKSYPGTKPADFANHRAAIRASLKRPGHWTAFSRLTKQLTHAPAQARLGELAALAKPALVVVGSKDLDWKDPAAEGRFVAAALGGELVMVEGAGHYPMAQYPEVVNTAVVEFLARAVSRA